jgi:hypothetical protein
VGHAAGDIAVRGPTANHYREVGASLRLGPFPPAPAMG